HTVMELGWPRDAMEPEARDRFGPTVLRKDGTDPLNQLLDVGLPLVCFTLGLQSDGQAPHGLGGHLGRLLSWRCRIVQDFSRIIIAPARGTGENVSEVPLSSGPCN